MEEKNAFSSFSGSFLLTLALLGIWSAKVSTVNAQRNPGLTIRHSKRHLGIYHQEIILGTQLEKKLKQSIVLEAEGNTSANLWSRLHYSLKDVIVTGYEPPKANVSITTANGIILAMSVGKIALRGKYTVALYSGPWLQSSRSGNLSMSILGTFLRMQRQIVVMDNKEKIRWKSLQCSASIKDVEIDVSDPESKSLIATVNLREHLKSYEERFCDASKYFLDVDLDLSYKISEDIYLDKSLLRQPLIYDGYVEFYHRGEVRYIDDDNEYTPLPHPFGPLPLQSNKMITARISDFLLNSFGFIYHSHNLLTCTFTKSDLPRDRQHLLNTSCEDGCFGRLFPIASTKYPHSSVEMNLLASEPPRFEIIPGFCKDTSEFKIDANVRLSNDSTVLLFSVHLSFVSTVLLSMKNNRIYFEIERPDFNITVTESSIGDLPRENLLVAIEQALDKIFVLILPTFKTIGFDLQIPKGFSIREYEYKWNNGELSLLMDLNKEQTRDSFVHLPEQRLKPRCGMNCYIPWSVKAGGF